MRVIAGSARRLLLETAPGDNTRPTTDRIKETLFNILSYDIPGCNFLDVFAGSGGIGIEALSRGAEKAVFIEKDPAALKCINRNLERTHFTENSRVIKGDAATSVSMLRAANYGVFDIVFMDPPYGKGLAADVLRVLRMSDVINDETLIIVEESIRAEAEEVVPDGYKVTRVKDYKTNRHFFLRRDLQGEN